MSRKAIVNSDVKIEACKQYRDGKGSIQSIAKSIGVDQNTVRDWYNTFIHQGPCALETSYRNKSYSKEFKITLVKSYLSGEFSVMELSGKHNVSQSVVKSWIRQYNKGIELKDYDPKGEVYTMKSRKTTYEERLEIVKWVIINNFNYKEAAEKYGVKYASIYNWVQKYLVDDTSLEYKKRGPRVKANIDESKLGEIERLQRELERERIRREQAEFRLELLKKKESFEKIIRSRK